MYIELRKGRIKMASVRDLIRKSMQGVEYIDIVDYGTYIKIRNRKKINNNTYIPVIFTGIFFYADYIKYIFLNSFICEKIFLTYNDKICYNIQAIRTFGFYGLVCFSALSVSQAVRRTILTNF